MDNNNFNGAIQLMNMVMMLLSMGNLIVNIEKIKNKDKRFTRSRRWWVRPTFRDRSKNGYFNKMYKHIKLVDPEHFQLHTRMFRESYDELCRMLKPRMMKNSIRPAIGFECRLAVTLSYLSQGVPLQALSWSFKMGKSTVRENILETCNIIWQVISPTHVKPPNTREFEQIAHDFWELWNLPNCVGAIDGKHIAINQPPNSGSLYYNYKNFYSIVLLAASDARHRFTMVDVGAYGSQSDGGIFAASDFGSMFIQNELPLPQATALPNSNKIFEHYYVGDAAFQINRHLMRPFPGNDLTQEKRIFNYRISRARMIIENAFGLLVTRWRILLTTINVYPRNVERIVLACVALHNYVITRDRNLYCPINYVDWEDEQGNMHGGEWRNEAIDITTHSGRKGNRCSRDAFNLRNLLTTYLCNEGAIPKQTKFINWLY